MWCNRRVRCWKPVAACTAAGRAVRDKNKGQCKPLSCLEPSSSICPALQSQEWVDINVCSAASMLPYSLSCMQVFVNVVVSVQYQVRLKLSQPRLLPCCWVMLTGLSVLL